jgi:hypothetical protein
MSKRKAPAKDITLTPPPEAAERLAPEDRAALREAALECQVARQHAQLLVHEHGRAVAAAKAAEQRYQQASAAVIERYRLAGADQVDIGTGVITRAPAAPAPEASK